MTTYSLIDGDRKSYGPRHTNPFSSSPEDNMFAKRPEFGGLASFMDEGLESSAGQILKIMKEEGLNKARRERMKAVGGTEAGGRIEELNRGLQGAIGTYNKGRKSQGGNKNNPPIIHPKGGEKVKSISDSSKFETKHRSGIKNKALFRQLVKAHLELSRHDETFNERIDQQYEANRTRAEAQEEIKRERRNEAGS